MKKKFLAVAFGAVLVLGACGGNDDKKEKADETSTGGETASVDAEQVINNSCITCHGGNLEGRGSAPALAQVGAKLSKDEIHEIVAKGKGTMPPFEKSLSAEEIEAVSDYLANKK